MSKEENKLIIEGKEIPLSEESAKKIKEAFVDGKEWPGDKYYFIDAEGIVHFQEYDKE